MTTKKVPELSAKLMKARMRRKMVKERWHMGFKTTKQNKTKNGTATTIQSHIWDQEVITVSVSFCSAKMNITLKSHSSHSSHSTLNTSSACTAT